MFILSQCCTNCTTLILSFSSKFNKCEETRSAELRCVDVRQGTIPRTFCLIFTEQATDDLIAYHAWFPVVF